MGRDRARHPLTPECNILRLNRGAADEQDPRVSAVSHSMPFFRGRDLRWAWGLLVEQAAIRCTAEIALRDTKMEREHGCMDVSEYQK